MCHSHLKKCIPALFFSKECSSPFSLSVEYSTRIQDFFIFFLYLFKKELFFLWKKRGRDLKISPLSWRRNEDESFIIVYSSPQSICAAAAGTLAGLGGGHALLLKD